MLGEIFFFPSTPYLFSMLNLCIQKVVFFKMFFIWPNWASIMVPNPTPLQASFCFFQH